MVALHQQLAAQFAARFISGERFETIVAARHLAAFVLGEKILPGTPAAKIVDESVEQGVVWAARSQVRQSSDPLQVWSQCLDLYDRQPPLMTRTSTSVSQQAYSTPIPIAYLAGKLAQINQQTTVYEPSAGNGSLLVLADPQKAIVNEINSNRAAALRMQGFTVTERDASTFLPQVEPVDRIIANPPFGSLKSGQGRTRTFRSGALTTTQLDHAIALLALELMKPDGRAVLILGGKMGDERSRIERYNTQLTRGFYRWLYKDAGYKVVDHFSLAGSLYRKQGTTFPIDLIVIEGKGETEFKLPGVSPPRVYENYTDLREVLVHAIQQQPNEPGRDSGITIQPVHTGMVVDTSASIRNDGAVTASLDNSIGSAAIEADRQSGGILFPADAASGMADRAGHPILQEDIRGAGGERGGAVDSASNQRVSTDIHQQLGSLLKSPADGTALSDGLSGTTNALFPNVGATISADSLSRTRKKLEVGDGHESDRLVDVDGYGREVTLLSGLNTMSDPKPVIEPEIAPQQEVALSNQVSYTPRSKATSLGTRSPAATLAGLENAFNKIEATTGLSIDEYVRTRLNERSLDDLFSHYAAEQIDSLALAIYNHEYENKATLVGHDTGIGKTRIVCGLARYAKVRGMIPTIVTVDPVLYADILARDAVDTGNNFNPLITNNGFNLSLDSSNLELGEIRTPKNQIEKIRQFTQTGNIGEHDCIFTTYGQLTGPASIERRQLLEAIAPKSFLILDESHKAGGAAAHPRPKSQAELARLETGDSIPSCTEFFQQLVTQTQGFVASSATAIKDPIIAARLFYQTTDLRLAATDRDTFTEHLKAGGVPLQQMVFAMWASSGGCIRCEKSYEGIEFGVAKVPVSLQTAENNSKILNLIWQFDRIKHQVVNEISSDLAEAGEAARANNPALGETGASSTNFTSVLHNLTAVTSLGLKAQATADEVIKDIEQGRKPIVMLFNTMESAIKNFIDTHNDLASTHNATSPDEPMKRIEVGDAVSINASELFTRYLDSSRTIKIVEPYLDELTGKQVVRTHRLTDEELGPKGVAAYNRANDAIACADWSSLPISPIDYIKQKIEDAGHSIGEITGRTHILKYDSVDSNKLSKLTYGTREHGTAQKKQVMDDFQNGRLDAIITNSTTGYSLHAAITVADRRQRVMYLVQPHLDVNQVEQSIGRSHRSGQVNPGLHPPDRLDDLGRPMWGEYPGTFGLPVFKLVVGENLPTEERAVAVLMKKMAHLKANTTGNRSSSFGLKDMPDFINDYGDEVAANLMEQYPNLHADLDYPLGGGDEELSREKAIQKVTGRIVMLTSDEAPTPEQPYPSLARQAWLYDTLSSEYKELLAQKIALGENGLEAQKLDLQAEPISRIILNPGNPEVDSPFSKPAYLVEVLAKTGAKPNTTLQVINAIRSELGWVPLANPNDYDDAQHQKVREKGQHLAQQTVEQLRSSCDRFIDTLSETRSPEIQVLGSRIALYQEKLAAHVETEQQLQQLQETNTSGNQTLANETSKKLEQLQPKISKLNQQISKAQLDLNGKKYQLRKEQRVATITRDNVSNLLTQFPVGQPVRLLDMTSKNFLYGIVAGVEQKGRANNPASPSNWKFQLLVVDGVRSISVRLDKLLGFQQHLEPMETAASCLATHDSRSIYQLFDERQTEAKEKRYLVSGQVMKAQLTGKFAQVTDDRGQVHPVYLLRRGFDPEQDLDKKPIKLETTELIKRFLFDATNKTGVVQTNDGNLSLVADIRAKADAGIVLKAAKATSTGGLYFKDEGLLQLTGDFVSKTEIIRSGNSSYSQSLMVVSVPSAAVNEVLSYISQKWGVGAASHKDVAREMLGQSLPVWEATDAINPDLERPSVLRISQFSSEQFQQSERAHNSTAKPLELSKELIDKDSVTLITTQSAIALTSTSTAQERTVDAPDTNSQERVNIAKPPAQKRGSLGIAQSQLQSGVAEKNIARLLHQAGLAQQAMQGEDFHTKIENEPYIPLSIERYDQTLYLTHFLEDNAGDLFIDSEMVFHVSADGQLSLSETATQDPFTGGEYRSKDREFANIFSKNLLDQGFAAAALRTRQEKAQPQQTTPSVANSSASQPVPVLNTLSTPEHHTSQPAPATPPLPNEAALSLLLNTSPVVDERTDLERTNQPVPSTQPAPKRLTEQALPSTPQSGSDLTKQPASSTSPVASNRITAASPSTTTKKPSPHKTASSLSTPTPTQPTQAEPVAAHQQLSLFDTTTGSAAVKQVSTTSISQAQTLELTSTNTRADKPQSIPAPVIDRVNEQGQGTSKQNQIADALGKTDRIEPMQVFQELVDRLDRRTGDFLANLTSSSPSLDTLRQWYKAARELGQSPKYLERIASVGNEFKHQQVLPEKAHTAMHKDLSAHYERGQILKELDSLSDRDFLLLHQSVNDSLKAAPTLPPSQAEVQSAQAEIAQLNTRRENLFEEYSRLNDTINSAGKKFLGKLNPQYKQAISTAENVLSQISTILTQQGQKESQIIKWNQLAQAYRAWESDPKTVQVQQIAQVLELPQMQERLMALQQAIGQQEQAKLTYDQKPKQHRQQHRGLAL